MKSSAFQCLLSKLTVAHVWAGDRQLSESSGKASRLVYSLPAQWSQSSIPRSKLTQPKSEHKSACSYFQLLTTSLKSPASARLLQTPQTPKEGESLQYVFLSTWMQSHPVHMLLVFPLNTSDWEAQSACHTPRVSMVPSPKRKKKKEKDRACPWVNAGPLKNYFGSKWINLKKNWL